MEETPERLDRVSRLEELGPRVEDLFRLGHARVPLVVGHRVDPVVQLLRSGKNVALIGKPSSGKRSLAYSLERSEVWSEEPQLTLRFQGPGPHPNAWPAYRTTVRHWLDGAVYVGNLEQKVSLLLRRIKDDVVIILEAAHEAIGSWQGRGESLDLVDLLVDVAAHPQIHLVLTTTPEGWSRLREKKPAFANQFAPVTIDPPDETESRMIVSFGLDRSDIGQDSIEEAFRLSAAHFPQEAALGPALRLLTTSAESSSGAVSVNSVRDTCAQIIGVGRRWIGADKAPTRQAVLSELESEVLGQREACSAIANDLLASAQGLSPHDRPLSYVLAGTPGIGKTSLARAVQHVIATSASEPLRFDCTEYSASQLDVLRLLASEPGSLVTGLMGRPGAVVLLDEIDRLHPAGRDLLYQLLGEGRITSLGGEVVSSSNSVVIMTTNVGSEAWFGSSIGRSEEKSVATTKRACIQALGPAIASRLTRILVLRPLDVERGASIVRRELDALLSNEALKERGISLQLSEALVAGIAELGVSSTLGARALHRLIHETVSIPVARYLSEHPDAAGMLALRAIRSATGLEGVRIEPVSELECRNQSFGLDLSATPVPRLWN